MKQSNKLFHISFDGRAAPGKSNGARSVSVI